MLSVRPDRQLTAVVNLHVDGRIDVSRIRRTAFVTVSAVQSLRRLQNW